VAVNLSWDYNRVGHLSRLEIYQLAEAIAREKNRHIAHDTLQKLPAFIGVANSAIRTKGSIKAARGVFEKTRKDLMKAINQ
jgi:hypothetical protein